MEKEAILLQANEIQKKFDLGCNCNYEKRVLYSESELLLIKIEKRLGLEANNEDLIRAKECLTKISSTATIGFVDRKHSEIMCLVDKIDQIVRLISVWLCLALTSVFVALPMIILSPLENFLVKCGILSVYTKASVLCRVYIGHFILLLSGIYVVIEGVNHEHLGKEFVLTCFSHASTMDAFLIAAAIPVTSLSIVSFLIL